MRPSRDELGLSADNLPSYTNQFKLSVPRFKRIDFSDVVDEAIEERKPAWKSWQESIKDSYYQVSYEIKFFDSQLEQQRHLRRSQSPFEELSLRSGSRRLPSYRLAGTRNTGSLDSGERTSLILGPYAAPAVSVTAGIESRYDSKVDDVEARLLKTSILPDSMKTVTKRTPRKSSAPVYTIDPEDESYIPRPYYSRPPHRDDPDYFDFDLQYSVDMYKRPEGKYVPKGPQVWEEKLLGEAKAKGDVPLSGYMFTKGDSDWRTNGTSYLSAALRTPSFWEHRFESMGREVRDSNPISLESIARNKPTPSRWTEYHDPELEDDLSDSD
ncbi:unnamed protein product [Enterobius vermicularis]|uniref:INCENP_ARK-bind domain-containing protein n=1 Tax=Enterobius vermicularis TaxID=51028 RepID=A0A0N4VDL8_ENTVE|nr:unnamed protein product [Enterobius vermicularis]